MTLLNIANHTENTVKQYVYVKQEKIKGYAKISSTVMYTIKKQISSSVMCIIDCLHNTTIIGLKIYN